MAKTLPAQDTQLIAEINITPFTDVLLVLLIIFMILAALSTPPGFQKQLPHPGATAVALNPRLHDIRVEITAANKIFIDGRPVAFAELYRIMAATVSDHDKLAYKGYSRHISLLADSETSYNSIMKVLDAARQAGDDDVGFVTL